jgi:hypothetical protein
MLRLLAAFHISAALGHCAAAMVAFALSMLHPAPHRASEHRHQPVRLPELASVATAGRLR